MKSSTVTSSDTIGNVLNGRTSEALKKIKDCWKQDAKSEAASPFLVKL